MVRRVARVEDAALSRSKLTQRVGEAFYLTHRVKHLANTLAPTAQSF